MQRNTPGNADISGSSVALYKPVVRQMPKQNGQIKPPRIANLNELKVRNQPNIQSGRNGIIQQPATPVNTTPERLFNQQKINSNTPSVNEKLNPAMTNQNRVLQPQNNNPVIKQPVNQANINRVNIQSQPRDFQKQNINRQPVNRNNPPANVRIMNQPNGNFGNRPVHVSPAPVNRQPYKSQYNNRQSPQYNNIRQAPLNRPLNRPQINHSPIIRNQNQGQQQQKSNVQDNQTQKK